MIRPAVVNRRVKKITKNLGRGAGAHSPHAAAPPVFINDLESIYNMRYAHSVPNTRARRIPQHHFPIRSVCEKFLKKMLTCAACGSIVELCYLISTMRPAAGAAHGAFNRSPHHFGPLNTRRPKGPVS